jgi:hypothetical protein
MEFANGSYGLMEAALAYTRDNTAPEATMAPNGAISQTPVDTTFRWVNEPSVIHYTTDGSTPTMSSPVWNAEAPRQPGQRFRVSETTTFKWLAIDIKGNTSPVESALFTIDDVDPTIDLRLPVGGQYLLHSAHEVDYSCDDNDAGVVRCEGTQADGDALDTSTPGYKTFTVEAEDAAGNTATTSVTYQVVFDWSGFFAPVSNEKVNVAQAGSAIPVKFKLGVNYGPGIFAEGYPRSRPIACESGAPSEPIEQTVTPGASELSYGDNQYNYVWKTQAAWANTCRELEVKLVDNTVHTALFKFKK